MARKETARTTPVITMEAQQLLLDKCLSAQVLSLNVGEISYDEAVETMLVAGVEPDEASMMVLDRFFDSLVEKLVTCEIDIDVAISRLSSCGVSEKEALFRLASAPVD
jgi:hypothetical protein